MQTSLLKPEQWGLIFTLLSLDIMRPMHEFMGLRITEKERFVAMLRRLIIENRRAYEANTAIIPPPGGQCLASGGILLRRGASQAFLSVVNDRIYRCSCRQSPVGSLGNSIFLYDTRGRQVGETKAGRREKEKHCGCLLEDYEAGYPGRKNHRP